MSKIWKTEQEKFVLSKLSCNARQIKLSQSKWDPKFLEECENYLKEGWSFWSFSGYLRNKFKTFYSTEDVRVWLYLYPEFVAIKNKYHKSLQGSFYDKKEVGGTALQSGRQEVSG